MDKQGSNIKRSRRVVLTMMGTAAVSAVSMGFGRRSDCGPGWRLDMDGRQDRDCRIVYGGFGGGGYSFAHHGHGHGGHGG